MRYRYLFGQVSWRLALLVLLPMLLIFGGVLAGSVRELSRARAYQQLQEQVRAARDELGREPAVARLAPGPDYPALCRDLGRRTRSRAVILRADGAVLGDSTFGSYTLAQPRSRPDLALALDGESSTQRLTDAVQRADFLCAAAPIRGDGRVVGVLSLVRSWDGAARARWQLFWTIVTPMLGLALLLLLAARSLSLNLGAVVRDLSRKATRFGGGTGVDEVAADDPFLQLTFDLNAMGRRLEDQVATVTREKRQWETLFTAMREGFLAVDRDLQILTINQAARHLLGVPAAPEPVGRPMALVLRNADLNAFLAALLEGPEPFAETTIAVRSESGDPCHLRLSGVRLRDTERGGALVVLHDITRLKRLEEVRREFVANVSHELKTPLTAMKGFLEPIEQSLGVDEAQARRFLHIVDKHTDRMNAIIEDLLTLSRLEQYEPGAAPGFESRDLAECVRQAVTLCGPKLAARRINLECTLPPLTCHANHRLLEQAVANLLDNAVKYSPEGAPVQVELAASDDQVRIAVTDHGIGIAPEHQERIFERFYRVDKSRDRQTGGTGLGLAIVKHIVRLHGGTVTVASALGKGSCFTLALPRAAAPAGPLAHSKTEPA